MRRVLAALLAGSLALTPVIARAQDDQGVHHFRTGVRLYKDGNFTGALAEFEEAQKLHPTASVLSNVALCQKALFRYAEAIQTLQKMLSEYGGSLSADDAKVANAAIAELRGLVTNLTIAVTPETATVTVDGHELKGGAERTLVVNVGERRVVAEAPGYRKSDDTIAVAGADKRVVIALVADAGHLNVSTDDPEAAIYVDGKEGAYGKWSGSLSAGIPHTITVFKPGYNPSNTEVTLATGESRDVKAAVGERFQGASAPPTPYPYVRPVQPERRHGPYALIGATAFQMGTMPDNLTSEGTGKPSGTYFGVRGGYLLIPNLGIEAMFEAGRHSSTTCFNLPAGASCRSSTPGVVDSSFDLTGYRFGVAARYITGGETFRFLADLGFGGVYHKLSITNESGKPIPGFLGGEGGAVGGTVFGDIGLEVSITRVLLDFVLSAAGDGVSGISIANQKVFTTSSGTIGYGGLGVRVGYAFW